MKKTKRRMVAFYGSQTGTAEEYATRLSKEGMAYGMRGVVADPEECDMEDLAHLKDVEEFLEGRRNYPIYDKNQIIGTAHEDNAKDTS